MSDYEFLERLAGNQGKSRSEIYNEAIRTFIASYTGQETMESISLRLNILQTKVNGIEREINRILGIIEVLLRK
jgi:metal-responsive CopG/Arc/MetJ family transcriptional regulator